jgi:hypothetical protein
MSGLEVDRSTPITTVRGGLVTDGGGMLAVALEARNARLPTKAAAGNRRSVRMIDTILPH